MRGPAEMLEGGGQELKSLWQDTGISAMYPSVWTLVRSNDSNSFCMVSITMHLGLARKAYFFLTIESYDLGCDSHLQGFVESWSLELEGSNSNAAPPCHSVRCGY